MEVLQHHYLVRELEHHPATLFGAPIVNYHHPITVDYGQPCIFFPRTHPLQWFPDFPHYGPMVAVHVINVAPSAVGDSFTLPPLAASLMLQPVNHPALYVVPLSSLWVTIPAFFDYRPPVLILDHYVPQVLAPPPPAWVLGPPPPPPTWVLEPPAPGVYGRGPTPWIPHPNDPVPYRTVYIRFVAAAAPITGEELDSFFRERLRGLESIEQIQTWRRKALVTFSETSGEAAVERIFHGTSREIQFHIQGKVFWAYPHRFWLETHRDRQAIITFEREEAPSEAEVYGHFNRGSPEMHSLESVRVKPLHAMLFFYTSAAAQQLIQKEPPSFNIGGKTVRAKRPD